MLTTVYETESDKRLENTYDVLCFINLQSLSGTIKRGARTVSDHTQSQSSGSHLLKAKP